MLIHVSLHPVALKGVVPTNYPATTEPYGLRRPKRTNALMANCCTRRQRPSCRRAAEQLDELASVHSITSSALMEIEALFVAAGDNVISPWPVALVEGRRRARWYPPGTPDSLTARKAKVLHQVNSVIAQSKIRRRPVDRFYARHFDLRQGPCRRIRCGGTGSLLKSMSGRVAIICVVSVFLSLHAVVSSCPIEGCSYGS
jgi:hypothetical protein